MGWEIELSGAPIRTPRLDLRLRLSLSMLHSEAVDLDGDPLKRTSLPADNLARIQEGATVPVYVGERVANPEANADPVVEQDAVIGPAYPTRLMGIGVTLAIDRLRVDALAEHQGGHYLPNYTGYQSARRGSWFPCLDVQERMIAKLRGDTSALGGVRALDRARCGFGDAVGYDHDPDFWVERADFWKLRSVTVAYELPASLGVGHRANVFLSARNLLTWTDYSGTDPEMMDFADLGETAYDGEGDYGRRDYYQIPNPRTYILGVRVSW